MREVKKPPTNVPFLAQVIRMWPRLTSRAPFPRPVRRDDIDILPGLEARVAQRCKDAERDIVILSDKALTP